MPKQAVRGNQGKRGFIPGRGKKHLAPGRMEKIRKLSDAGLTERQIALVLGVSKTTVHYWLGKETN